MNKFAAFALSTSLIASVHAQEADIKAKNTAFYLKLGYSQYCADILFRRGIPGKRDHEVLEWKGARFELVPGVTNSYVNNGQVFLTRKPSQGDEIKLPCTGDIQSTGKFVEVIN